VTNTKCTWIADDANPASRHLAEVLVEFCSSMGSELK
jgi:hypothetical protein